MLVKEICILVQTLQNTGEIAESPIKRWHVRLLHRSSAGLQSSTREGVNNRA